MARNVMVPDSFLPKAEKKTEQNKKQPETIPNELIVKWQWGKVPFNYRPDKQACLLHQLEVLVREWTPLAPCCPGQGLTLRLTVKSPDTVVRGTVISGKVLGGFGRLIVCLVACLVSSSFSLRKILAGTFSYMPALSRTPHCSRKTTTFISIHRYLSIYLFIYMFGVFLFLFS